MARIIATTSCWKEILSLQLYDITKQAFLDQALQPRRWTRHGGCGSIAPNYDSHRELVGVALP